VLPKRDMRDEQSTLPSGGAELDPTILAAETLRSGASKSEVQMRHNGNGNGDGGGKPDEKVPILWRVLGGTILSIVALVVITAYQSLTGLLRDMQGEISQLKESKADFVKKDEHATSRKSIWDRFTKEQSDHNHQFQTITGALEAMKGALTRSDEGLKAEVVRLSDSLKALQGEKRELHTTMQAAVGQVRDKQTAFEQQLKSAEQSLQTVEQQVKAVEQCARDLQATNVTVSALQAASASRETHQKHADEHRAELAKAVAELRERLAKMEVTLPNKPPAKPVSTKPQPPPKAEEDPDG
jgi:myosin heavy subunit